MPFSNRPHPRRLRLIDQNLDDEEDDDLEPEPPRSSPLAKGLIAFVLVSVVLACLIVPVVVVVNLFANAKGAVPEFVALPALDGAGRKKQGDQRLTPTPKCRQTPWPTSRQPRSSLP